MKNVSSRDLALGVFVTFAIGVFVFWVSRDDNPYPYYSDNELEARTYLDIMTSNVDFMRSADITACGYYNTQEWSYTDALAALHKDAAEVGDEWTEYYRSAANAIERIDLVIEAIALREDFALQAVATIEANNRAPLAYWGEAELAQHRAAVVAKKRPLLRHLCSLYIH